MGEERKQPNWGKIQEEKGWDRMTAAELPEPTAEMSPEEKGALLLRYVAVGRQMATKKRLRSRYGDPWDRLDFRFANLVNADLSGARLERVFLDEAHLEGANLWKANLEAGFVNNAHLEGADLREAHLEQSWFTGSHLEGAALSNAHLEKATLTFSHLEGASLFRAHLEGADLHRTHLEGTDLRRTHLEGANLIEAHLEGVRLTSAHLEGAKFSGSTGTPGDRRSAHISAATYTESAWNPATLREWLRAGAILADFENLPLDVQEALNRDREGLTLYFNTRLHFIEETNIRLAIAMVLGPDTDCEHTTQHEEDLTVIRLTGAPEADLYRVAAQLTLWSYRAEEAPSPAATRAGGLKGDGPRLIDGPTAQAVPQPAPDASPGELLSRRFDQFEALYVERFAQLEASVRATLETHHNRVEITLPPEVMQRLEEVTDAFWVEHNQVVSLDTHLRKLTINAGGAAASGVIGNAAFAALVYLWPFIFG